MATVTITVPDEVKSLADALLALAVDIKAKKGAAAILADTLPGLMAAAGQLQAIGADLKQPEVHAFLALELEKIAEAVLA